MLFQRSQRWRPWLGLVILVAFLSILVSRNVASPPLSNEQILSKLSRADIIYLGEVHDSEADHQAQLEIVLGLYRQNQDLAIGFEMFQRPFQPFLDRYLAGEIDEATLIKSTEYEERWGFGWEFYAPMIRFARAHKLSLLALNTPREITRKVSKNGIDSLSGSDFRYIPPREDIDLGESAYRDRVKGIFEGHMGMGNADGFERFWAAQVLWDETMADAIAEFHQTNPDTQIIVLTGRFHVQYGEGIPSRVARRLGTDVKQEIVLFGEEPDESWSESLPPGDYFWQH
ncbi:MAG: ChaN family lipoprotein [Cyanobacteria bacterium P01_H01_bin.15]